MACAAMPSMRDARIKEPGTEVVSFITEFGSQRAPANPGVGGPVGGPAEAWGASIGSCRHLTHYSVNLALKKENYH